MHTAHPVELNDSWVDGRADLRWRSIVGTEPPDATASGSSLLEVDPGCALPRHTYEAPVQPDGEQERQTIG